MINLMFSRVKIFLYSEERPKKVKVFKAHIESEEAENMGKTDKMTNST